MGVKSFYQFQFSNFPFSIYPSRTRKGVSPEEAAGTLLVIHGLRSFSVHFFREKTLGILKNSHAKKA